jgi:hypothetical protein
LIEELRDLTILEATREVPRELGQPDSERGV